MTIERIRSNPGGTDAYGDPIPGTTSKTALTGAYVWPRHADDVTGRGRDGVIVGLSLCVPVGTDLVRTDSVEVDGIRYEIEGEPGAWRHPNTAWEAGIVVALRRAEG